LSGQSLGPLLMALALPRRFSGAGDLRTVSKQAPGTMRMAIVLTLTFFEP
jgi:hypothetical protein